MERREERRVLRRQLFKLVYLYAFHNSEEMPSQIDLFFDACDEETTEMDQELMIADHDLSEDQAQELVLEALEVIADHREEVAERFSALISHIAEIDELLNRVARGWKTQRFASCDLAILRLAVYEMRFDEKIPAGVAINEAVELAKLYGGEESPSFINGILGEIARMS
ncbi:MAG: transcription antitermination factor NusB [Lachnospiraceae bacterium]|nr:transcription antitermination factor NusB [Lachnospiraceae bacterium]